MPTRREARRRAIEMLYQADLTGADPVEVFDEWTAAGREADRFARSLVEGVAASSMEIDAVIASHSENWPLDRMAAVDRVVLRVATYELLLGEVPPAVAIDEAVRAAKDLSTDDSGAFVNGILGRIAAERN